MSVSSKGPSAYDYVAMGSQLLNSGVQLFNSISNYNSQRDINQANIDMTKESWSRDDKSFSRAYDDIVSKGFSPLAALGQSFGNTNPASLSAPLLSGDLSSVASGAESMASRALERKSQEVAKNIADAQVNNLDADTRNKNASADVNEATTAVQVLKAKAELDGLIQSNNMSETQIVKYLNDMKSEGISDSVIDSLLSQFRANPNNPTISAGDLSGNKTITGQQGLTTAQTHLADANKALSNAQTALAKANTTSVDNQNKYWTDTKAELQKSIDKAEASVAVLRSTEVNDRNINGSVTIIDQNGTKRTMHLSTALDYLDARIKDAQYSLSVSKLGSDELKDSLSVLDSILGALGTIGNILGPLGNKK